MGFCLETECELQSLRSLQSLESLENFSSQHKYDIMQTAILSCLLLCFELNRIIPNMTFKSLSLTFSFGSSCFICLSVIFGLRNLPIYFCYVHFALLSLYFLLFCFVLNNLMLSVLNFSLLLNLCF